MSDKDTIYRQDAIDALADYIHNVDKVMGTGHLTEDDCKDAAASVFEELPSAQPEIPFEIQDILDYLDKELHPIISPEHWNVYSELHDMISTLPSAQPEQRWIPCSERLPEKSECYLVSGKWANGRDDVDDCVFSLVDGCFETAWGFDVLAWMPLPKPWKGEKDG